jgi:hypothetical protein
VIQPRYLEQPARARNPRSARAATQRRIVKKSRARYTTIVQVSLVVGALMTILMAYVVLTSSMTGLSYAVANAKHEREALQEESMRLDDRIAALRSDDRLSALAARLNMHEPQRYAVVHVPAPQVADDRHLAVISSLAGFLMPAVARQQR